MFQKEVAERICEPAGSKKYGISVKFNSAKVVSAQNKEEFEGIFYSVLYSSFGSLYFSCQIMNLV